MLGGGRCFLGEAGAGADLGGGHVAEAAEVKIRVTPEPQQCMAQTGIVHAGALDLVAVSSRRAPSRAGDRPPGQSGAVLEGENGIARAVAGEGDRFHERLAGRQNDMQFDQARRHGAKPEEGIDGGGGCLEAVSVVEQRAVQICGNQPVHGTATFAAFLVISKLRARFLARAGVPPVAGRRAFPVGCGRQGRQVICARPNSGRIRAPG